MTIRVTSRGGRDAIHGKDVLADGCTALKLRVRTAPEDGAANEAVCRLLARALGRPASAVTVASGHTSRVKTLAIAGEDGAELKCALEHLVASEPVA